MSLAAWDFAAAPVRAVEGRYWRMLSPRWSSQPLSGAGAARNGGRWNARGQGALYLSASHATAVAEYLQDLIRPGTLAPYDVLAPRILDLTDASIRASLNIDPQALGRDWRHVRDVEQARPASWDFADAALDAGYEGLRVASARSAGVNLVLWRWNVDGGARVTTIDPNADLPRDGASWS